MKIKLAFYFLLSPIICLAQDADMEAQAYYTRAEDYYNLPGLRSIKIQLDR